MEARRPWWRRKRWVAAGLLWLALPPAYFLSAGPVDYLGERQWLPPAVGRLPGYVYRPLVASKSFCPPLYRAFDEYTYWWLRLAARHSGDEGSPYYH